ncbi:murein hydrolase activator EnvC family protein [Hyphomicrobium methylovorum]|uniref:murein hydrolase activator EnvC family protein n=1 Tax=Hyphomicrobium methylovorum TaxID=84 RepID=UPI0031B59173
MALSLSAITQLRAQDEVPADPAAARQALDSKKQELDSNAAKELTIRSEVVSLSSERERLNARLIETANLIQRGEAQMTAIEGRLSELEAQERTVRGTLGERHGEIAALLAALQRMGRNPPPVLVTRREDALQMVRSAMLLASAFPDLRDQAVTLSGKLEKLQTVMASIRTEGARLKAETDRLNETRSRLASLMEVKKLTLAERQTELASVRVATAEISKSVNNLSELIGRLNTAVTEQTGLGTYNKELKAERAASELNVQTASAAPAPAPAPENPVPEALKPGPQVIRPPPLEPVPQATVEPKPVAEAKPAEAKVAILARSDAPKRSVIELAPEGTSVIPGNPGRIKPAIPFGSAKGKLPLPAQGARALAFGDRTQYGGQSKGIVIETRYGGQITSPCDGWVLYAGEFRSYGQLLIIDGGDGYLMLLAGLSQIDVQPGQFVLAAEPVGTMSVGQKNSPSSARVSGPVLYVELRKDGRPIDPDPWWASGQQKVQG